MKQYLHLKECLRVINNQAKSRTLVLIFKELFITYFYILYYIIFNEKYLNS